jgi:hypothetical protein
VKTLSFRYWRISRYFGQILLDKPCALSLAAAEGAFVGQSLQGRAIARQRRAFIIAEQLYLVYRVKVSAHVSSHTWLFSRKRAEKMVRGEQIDISMKSVLLFQSIKDVFRINQRDHKRKNILEWPQVGRTVNMYSQTRRRACQSGIQLHLQGFGRKAFVGYIRKLSQML